jgi:hypothetical protein
MNKIKMLISTLVIALAAFMAPLAISTVAFAAYTPPSDTACGGATGSAPGGTASCDSASGQGLTDVISAVINWFSWIVGAVSVIMIIYGGFRYITSGGDQNGVTAAKNTLLYAVIGLIVVALSQIIVKFVLNATDKVT